MDAPEVEQDIQLEKAAPNYLADLGQSLPAFLRRNGKVRRNVRTSETERLVSLLEPFQELPQLLDPHLAKYVPDLAKALLEYLRAPPSKKPTTHLLIPLSQAICKLLYTFCKIRGEKVIVQFFGTETRDLELLLSAIEKGTSWDWEDRYITLLWLSQLLLAPFDLASISSQEAMDVELNIPGLNCPPNVPTVTLRVISLAISHLSSSGKERDAAKILLVRVAMRPDMQQIGVLRSLVHWAISRLHPSAKVGSSQYFHIGILSFLAGMLVSSAGTPDMITYLSEIFAITREQDDLPTTILDTIRKSAVSRKIIIKIFRGIALLDLASKEIERVQTIIGDLLDFLEDESTPVRLAASKTLSIITSKLDSEMAAQVVDVILDTFSSTYRMSGPGQIRTDLSDARPSQWHGLILTFAHLLYRRSIPPGSLSRVVEALHLALAFEKRSVTSASSTGINVRDAANFGIWALARRYSTVELSEIDPPSQHLLRPSALQRLGTDLVVAGSLDPAGNVRRGSSAALQELIGRHPDTVAEGIQVVQVVDYNAIALRSRAFQVAINAAVLSDHYLDGLQKGLWGWRGLKDPDPATRRTAASAMGRITLLQSKSTSLLKVLSERVVELGVGDGVERHERHGLLLCMASIIELASSEDYSSHVMTVFDFVETKWSKFREQSLTAEACCKILIAAISLPVENVRWFSVLSSLLEKFMPLDDPGVISDAAAKLMAMAIGVSGVDATPLVESYIAKAKMGGAYLNVLFKIFPLSEKLQSKIINTIHTAWATWDSRVVILRCLGSSTLMHTHLESVKKLLEEGLDDFTITAQGDIGSKVRIEAVKAITASGTSSRFYGRVMRLAAEKLDRVRREGAKCLGLEHLEPSSEAYFRALLNMQLCPTWNPEWSRTFLSGYVTSVNGASDISLASRHALVKYIEAGNPVTLPRSPAGLEASAFLIDMGLMQRFPSRNVKCCTKEKLVAMLLHQYPSVRNSVADELWELDGVRGVDWTKGTKEDLERVRRDLASARASASGS
ncbi:related to tubulin-folding cofactor D (chaperone) [Rhynchosporium secalis]|uniref:Related to tubulin-folding cofactor D (Chaperone) n=1 Tax=Rhynchosporium secalis TaxID=38038 RepID=A0A1E1M2U9_RHYSE|nr:related to tubulin-folding cofactor D (chaperone) [Rhynchosporium secalis]